MRARAVLVELGAAGRGCLRVRPRSAPVAPVLDGADEGLVPLGDLGGALVADLARLWRDFQLRVSGRGMSGWYSGADQVNLLS